MRRVGLAVLAAAIAVLAIGLAGQAGAQAAQPPPAAAEVEQCSACHDEAVTGMRGTAHAGLEKTCASCHGDVSEHLRSNLEKGRAGPDRLDDEDEAGGSQRDLPRAATRADTRPTGRAAPTTGAASSARAATACTTSSPTRGQLKTATRPRDLLHAATPAIRAKSLRTSHHPVREGLMTCASCHNPHDGTKPKMVTANWVNEKCLECHTEKRGPFLWEHAPVRENCLNCHDPHGSNHDKLLVAQAALPVPALPHEHAPSRHVLRATRVGRGAASTASNRATEHACKNCHQTSTAATRPSAPYLGR